VPVFNVGGVPLAHKDPFRYLGMMFYRRMSMSSKHAAGPFMASAFRACQFVREKSLVNKPFVPLWIVDICAPSRYVCRPGAGHRVYLRGQGLHGDLQVRHISFLKGTLGFRRTTTNWAVLRECGREPLLFYWFRSVVKLYSSMLKSNSETLSRVLKADLGIHSRGPFCWTAS
jgi:hypothetical protein